MMLALVRHCRALRQPLPDRPEHHLDQQATASNNLALTLWIPLSCQRPRFRPCTSVNIRPHTIPYMSAPPPPPEPLFVLRGHRAAVQCAAFTPDSSSLAAGCVLQRAYITSGESAHAEQKCTAHLAPADVTDDIPARITKLVASSAVTAKEH